MSDNEIIFTESNFAKETASGVSLVDFWAPWCGPCRMQGPIVEEVAAEMAGKAKIGKLNVDENPAIAAQFGVSGIPTIIIFKNGKEAQRFVGLRSKADLISSLEDLS